MHKTIQLELAATSADFAPALADQLALLVAMLEGLLVTHVYQSEDEAWASPEAEELAVARELLCWFQGGPLPSTVPVH